MPSTQQRKEEREMRQSIAQARVAKKEAEQRQRRQRNAAAKKGVPVEPKKRFRLKGAMVLKSELQSGPTTHEAKGKKGKKGVAASVTASTTNTVEPPYSFEVHHKNAQVLVDVVLHKVPPQCIVVNRTSPTKLVVETPKYTKKFLLEFELPDGVRIVPDKAEYTFDTGVLKCVLPIAGEIPSELVQAREMLIESFKAQRGLRFRVSKDGDLVVRSRQAVLKKTDAPKAAARPAALAPSASAQAQPPAGAPEESKQNPAVATSGKRATAPESTAAVVNAKGPSTVAKSLTKSATPAAKHANPASSATARPRSAAPAASAAPSTKKEKRFVSDKEGALAIARESSLAHKAQLRQKLEKAKEVLQRRTEQSVHRDVRRNEKRARQQAAFQRVLEEQKQKLLSSVALAAPVPKKAATAGKSVSFSS